MKTARSSLIVMLLAALACLGQEPAPVRVVDLTAADGINLKASYFSSGKPGPGILLLHQCDHDRKIWDGLAQQLAAAGFNVLTMDLRGFGESGDQPHKIGQAILPEQMEKWPRDIDVAFQYLKSQPGVKADSIGVGGASCGVSNAIQTAMRHPEVRSLVLLSGPTEVKDREFLRKGSVPAFCAVADHDQYPMMVPFTEWAYVATANPGRKFEHYATGHHGAEMFALHPELPAAIVDWYETTLIKTPGSAPAPKDAPAIASEVELWDLLEKPGGPAQVGQKLAESRKKDPKASLVSAQMLADSVDKDRKKLEQGMEQMLGSLANQHFNAGDTQQGLEIAKLEALANPTSPVAYAVMAECYLALGKKDLARESANKALEVLPADTIYPQPVHDGIQRGVEHILKQAEAAK